MAAVTLAAGLLAVGCGSGGLYGGGSSGTTSPATSAPAASPTSALCKDAAALRASLDKLKHVSIGPGTGDEIKADVADVKAKLTALTAQAHGECAASTLASNPSASAVSEVVAGVREVASSGSSLLAALSEQCPSVSASPSM
jgi:hypothetical protein